MEDAIINLLIAKLVPLTIVHHVNLGELWIPTVTVLVLVKQNFQAVKNVMIQLALAAIFQNC